MKQTVTKCPVSGLPIITIDEFDNVQNNTNYYVSLKIIGDSILYGKSKGSLANFDLERDLALDEAFCEASNIKKPYVHIIDLKEVTGRIELKTVKKQFHYYYINRHKIQGLVIIENPSWLKPLIKLFFKLFNPGSFKVVTVKNYSSAITAAQGILLETSNKRGEKLKI